MTATKKPAGKAGMAMKAMKAMKATKKPAGKVGKAMKTMKATKKPAGKAGKAMKAMSAKKAAMKSMRVSTKSGMMDDDRKKDNGKPKDDDKKKDADNVVPTWACVPFRCADDTVEVTQVLGSRCTMSLDFPTSGTVAELLRDKEHPGCDESGVYECVGMAVAVIRRPQTSDDSRKDDDNKKDDDNGTEDDGKPKDDASKKDDDIGDETSGDNTDTSSSHMTPGPYNLMSGQ